MDGPRPTFIFMNEITRKEDREKTLIEEVKAAMMFVAREGWTPDIFLCDQNLVSAVGNKLETSARIMGWSFYIVENFAGYVTDTVLYVGDPYDKYDLLTALTYARVKVVILLVNPTRETQRIFRWVVQQGLAETQPAVTR